MNEAVKTTMRRFVAGTLAIVMVLTALLLVFVRPKAENAASQLPVLNETIVGTVKFQSFNFLGKNASGDDGVDYSATFYYTDDYFAHSAVNAPPRRRRCPGRLWTMCRLPPVPWTWPLLLMPPVQVMS